MSDDKAHGNVVYPQDWQRHPPDSREREAERRKRAAENRERDILRLRRLEEGHARGGKKGPVFRGLGDRIKAARANGEHVERARKGAYRPERSTRLSAAGRTGTASRRASTYPRGRPGRRPPTPSCSRRGDTFASPGP